LFINGRGRTSKLLREGYQADGSGVAGVIGAGKGNRHFAGQDFGGWRSFNSNNYFRIGKMRSTAMKIKENIYCDFDLNSQ
jgi:hypothetical protein